MQGGFYALFLEMIINVQVFGIFHRIDGQILGIQSIRMNAEKGGGKDHEGGLFMKKGKILIVGLIALLMAGALVLVSCRAGCEGAGTCEVDDNKGSVCTSSTP